MTDWIEVDPSAVSKDERTEIRGVEIRVGLSPYDIPEGVRGYYDKASGRLVIEFKYLDGDEPKEDVVDQNEEVSLLVGKHSNCLYEIRVNVDKIKAETVHVKLALPKIDRVLNQLASRGGSRRRYYEVAKAVLSEKADDLVAEPG